MSTVSNIKAFRPTNFNQVIGNANQIKSIKSSLERGEFPSFTIISGKSGIGKTTLAKIIAKSLICEKPAYGIACDTCPTCMKANIDFIRDGKEIPNVHIFRMSDQGGKLAARDVEMQIMSLPVGSDKKVILLEECQGMIREAQDLLLPRLEELPDYVHILAMTTDTSKLQDTFKGRCTPIRLHSPNQTEVQGLLSRTCQDLGLEVSGNACLNRIVEFGIRPRDCMNLLMKIAQTSKVVSMKEVNEVLSLTDETLYLKYLRAVKADMGAVLDFMDILKADDTEIASFMLGLNKFIMRLIAFKYRKAFIAESIILDCREFIRETDENDLMMIQNIIANEVQKYGSEKYDESLFISTAFLIQSRNMEKIKNRAIKTVNQVEFEKQEQIENLREKTESKLGESSDAYVVEASAESILSIVNGAKLIE